MSAKIFNGFRILTTDLAEITAICSRFVETLSRLRSEKVSEFLAITASDLIDRKTDEAQPLSAAYNMLVERQHKIATTQQRDPRADMEFNLAFWTLDGCVMGNVGCEHEEWVAAWMETDGVEEYAYFNNTDRPADISEEEWDKRADDWNLASRQMCFQNSLKTTNQPPTAEDVLAFIPSRPNRALTIAKQQIGSEMFADGGHTTADGYDAAMKILQELTSPEGKERVQIRATLIENTLVEITPEVLRGSFRKG